MADKYTKKAREIFAATPWRELEDAVEIPDHSFEDLQIRVAAALRAVERDAIEGYRRHLLATADGFAWVRISDQKPAAELLETTEHPC